MHLYALGDLFVLFKHFTLNLYLYDPQRSQKL